MIYPSEELAMRDGRAFIVRSAEADDAPRMLEYMKTMLGETPFLLRSPEEFSYTPEEEAEILGKRKKDPRGLMLVAETDGKIIACADISSHGMKARTFHRANLGMSVLKAYWHQGIGSALMERLIDAARQSGFEQIELEVVASNRRALGLYLKYGFEVYGTRPHGIRYADGSYADDYLMIRKLSS